MGRPKREYDPGGIYHLTTHGIDEIPIYRDDNDRQDFCIRFRRVAGRERWEIHAACLMDTHYHILLRPTLGSVSDGMKVLNGGYSRAFNTRHRRRGALFESRYSDRAIRDDEHYANTVDYIEQNPIAAGLTVSVEAWPWTTANAQCPLRVSDIWSDLSAASRRIRAAAAASGSTGV